MAGAANMLNLFRDYGRNVSAHLAHSLMGVPYVADPLVPEGQTLLMNSGGRVVVIGIPSRHEAEAALIVRHGLADVLEWLGKPVETLPLKLAREHYGLEDPS